MGERGEQVASPTCQQAPGGWAGHPSHGRASGNPSISALYSGRSERERSGRRRHRLPAATANFTPNQSIPRFVLFLLTCHVTLISRFFVDFWKALPPHCWKLGRDTRINVNVFMRKFFLGSVASQKEGLKTVLWAFLFGVCIVSVHLPVAFLRVIYFPPPSRRCIAD